MPAKCNGIIKFFSISKNEEEEAGPSAPSKTSIFCSAVFFTTYKITLETNICVKYVIYKFCLRHFSLKCIIKKNSLTPYCPLTDNNQIFRNCFVIIYCHLTKVSSQINKCIIFEPNELSIAQSTQ